jgi:hypothetical protein
VDTFSLIIAAITAALKFPTELKAFIELIQGTPAQQRAALLGQIKAASQKADDSKGNMDGYDDL